MAGLSEAIDITQEGQAAALGNPRRRVRIREILEDQYDELEPGDYVLVRLKWNSNSEVNRDECHFIFYEDKEDGQHEQTITAVLYTNSKGAKETYWKLSNPTLRDCEWKVQGFWIHFQPDNQSRLILNGNPKNFIAVPLEDMENGSSIDIHDKRKRQSDEEFLDHEMIRPKKIPIKIYDFNNQYKPLEVKVTPSVKYMDTSLEDTYAMRSKPRGIALIIHNYHYPTWEESIREGSLHDVAYLTEFLEKCFFKVVTKTDVTSEQLPTVISDFKKEAVADMNCGVVIFLGHGINGFSIMTDDKAVPLNESIVYEFDESKWPIFKGKPVLFLVQKCESLLLPTSKCRETIKLPEKIPKPSPDLKLENMIICFSAPAGSEAVRDIYLGSPFVYVLVDTLMEHAHDTHFVQILEVVQSRLKQIVPYNRDGTALHCTWTPHGFTKKLFFNPGL